MQNPAQVLFNACIGCSGGGAWRLWVAFPRPWDYACDTRRVGRQSGSPVGKEEGAPKCWF
jgi:hypothetical protein